jgi:Asp-tRNA(Asn)/Glu-tRNA(Gln) amidotransferase A subunit family amidase
VIDALTVCSARRLLAGRALGPVELLDATLAQLEATEPRVHAYAHVAADEARRRGRTLETAGRDRLLAGIPFGVKDVLETAGMRTEAGSRLLAGNVPSTDAEVVRRLRHAGAVLVGKHVTHELACGQDVPPTRNPWDVARYPGGSSAGGGVSVAVGSSLAAVGTDAGGSVRKPAAVTGVTGLKPTFGRVSRRGVVHAASAPSLDHVGLLARTVEDVATLLGVVAGHDAGDPASLRVAVPDYVSGLHEPVSGLRIGVVEPVPGAEPEPDVSSAVEDGLAELARLGVVLIPVRLPGLRDAARAAFTLFPAELARVHGDRIEACRDLYGDGTRRLLEEGRDTPPAELAAAEGVRGIARREVEAVFRDAGLVALATPTVPRVAMRLDRMEPARDVAGYVPYTAPWNLTGQPALSVPCGFDAGGLPIGLQLVGHHLDEATILRLGHAFQRATDWHCRRPPRGRVAEVAAPPL